MAGKAQRLRLEFTVEERKQLEQIRRSRTESVRRVERASILLTLADIGAVPETGAHLGFNNQMVWDTYRRYQDVGAIGALDDLPRSGRPPKITQAAKLWVIGIACQKPLAFDYPHELWTLRLLAQHVAKTCVEAGHDCLVLANASTVWRLLNAHDLKPHRVTYYLEKRDPLLTGNKSVSATSIALPRPQNPNPKLTAAS